MYSDTTVIRRLAADLRERGQEIRAEADHLVARTDAAGWLGQAGAALDQRVRERSLALRRSATRHDEAADALDRHAHDVERVQRIIEETERRARRLLDAADSWAQRWFRRFTPPPSGSIGWLEVEVPGL